MLKYYANERTVIVATITCPQCGGDADIEKNDDGTIDCVSCSYCGYVRVACEKCTKLIAYSANFCEKFPCKTKVEA